MPVRKSTAIEGAASAEAEVLAAFSKESLATFTDLDLQGLLRMLDLDEYNKNFKRDKAITRILQEQLHGFETVLNPDVFAKFVAKSQKQMSDAAIIDAAFGSDKSPTSTVPGGESIQYPSSAKVRIPSTVSKDGKKTVVESDASNALIETSGVVGSVTYGIRETKNLGNYESLQINVMVTLPLGATQEQYDEAFLQLKRAKSIVVSRLNDDMDELLKGDNE